MSLGSVIFVLGRSVYANVQSTPQPSNSTAILVPAGAAGGETEGTAAPYPSTIELTETRLIADVDVALLGLSHGNPDDLDVLLVGPGGQSVLLMSDGAGADTARRIDLGFSDEAAAMIPDEGPLASGGYQPSNYEGDADAFDAPAPPGPYGASLSVFDGTTPTGTWSLYVMDDAAGGVGRIAGGWALRLTLAPLVSIANARTREGNLSGSSLEFVVTLSSAPEADVSVDFATSDGTATAPGDYQAKSGTITFSAGETARSIFVNVSGDLVREPDEVMYVTLSNLVGVAEFADAKAKGT
ncbi:MAG TPA: Calx-beta domain-containing protein, partial [Actinomycetota bacterium]|nr:Calx-beta domain-containing protein [Actinomycetota bacterium]